MSLVSWCVYDIRTQFVLAAKQSAGIHNSSLWLGQRWRPLPAWQWHCSVWYSQTELQRWTTTVRVSEEDDDLLFSPQTPWRSLMLRRKTQAWLVVAVKGQRSPALRNLEEHARKTGDWSFFNAKSNAVSHCRRSEVRVVAPPTDESQLQMIHY